MDFSGTLAGGLSGEMHFGGDGDSIDVTPILTSGTKIATITVNEGTEEEISYDLYAPEGFSGSWNDLTDKPTLFSGVYSDLSSKPTLDGNVINGNMFTHIYSTNEQRIGTWIDGKPLYKITYIINETIYNQDKSIDVSSLNIDKYVSGEGTFIRNINWLSPVLYIDTPFNLYESSSNHSYLRYGITSRTMDYGVFLGNNETATDITFTIKYTKTTDSI